MNNKYFKNSIEWSENNTSVKGLPRPFAYTDPNGTNTKNVKRVKLPKIVPIPWQSKSNFINNGFLNLNIDNESLIYRNNLCPYCGIEINNDEITIRWKSDHLSEIKENGFFVFSDIHPFHLECMNQGRIFCPFMKKLKDENFEIDIFETLKEHANLEKEMVKNNER
jgi:hypothetical protein